MHTPKQLAIYLIITALLFSVVGFFVGRLVLEKGSVNLAGNKPAITDKEDTFQAGWNAARQKLAESDYIMAGDIRSLSGTIKEINGNKIILNTNLINPLDDETLKTRTVIIAENTRIEIQKEKTAQEMKTEEAGQKAKLVQLEERQRTASGEEEKIEIEAQIMNLRMPVDFLKLEIAGISDIKPGDNISVEAEEDIAEKSEFTAARVILYPSITEPEMPPLPEMPETLEAIE